MTRSERQEVKDTIDIEGFDYTFRYHSDFEHIEDEKFHELVKKYSEAANELEDYI